MGPNGNYFGMSQQAYADHGGKNKKKAIIGITLLIGLILLAGVFWFVFNKSQSNTADNIQELYELLKGDGVEYAQFEEYFVTAQEDEFAFIGLFLDGNYEETKQSYSSALEFKNKLNALKSSERVEEIKKRVNTNFEIIEKTEPIIDAINDGIANKNIESLKNLGVETDKSYEECIKGIEQYIATEQNAVNINYRFFTNKQLLGSIFRTYGKINSLENVAGGLIYEKISELEAEIYATE